MTPLDLAMQTRLRGAIEALRPSRAKRLAVIALTGFTAIAVIAEFERARAAAVRDKALQTLALKAQPASGSVEARIDQVARAPNGQWVVRGHAIDLGQPDIGAIAAVRQGDRIIVLGERPRLRPDIAAALGRADIADRRIGFLLALPERLDCESGLIELVVAFADGRAVLPPQEPLATICKR